MKLLKLSLALLLALALSACAAGVSESDAAKLSIVCTSFPCYDFARAVAGVAAEIRLLIKPGAEVHSYEPTPTDVLEIAQCDLFVYVGGESDVWVEDILASFEDDAPQTLRFFDCVEALEEEEKEGMTLPGEGGQDDGVEYDEHIWTSPVNAAAMVGAMRDALCALRPEQSTAFEGSAQAYIDRIMEIDAEFRAVVDSADRREMIFADRFPFLYFAREYGLDYYAAFPSCAAESEPSAKTLAFLIDRVRRDGIPAVYTIELSSGRTAQAIADETGAKILTFYSAQNLSETDFAAGETYVSLMERNVAVLQEGLNG